MRFSSGLRTRDFFSKPPITRSMACSKWVIVTVEAEVRAAAVSMLVFRNSERRRRRGEKGERHTDKGSFVDAVGNVCSGEPGG